MDVEAVLAENKIRPSKRQDQHFLKDEEIIEYEIELAQLEKNDVVLEIGAGIGNITEKLAEKSRVIAIERDSRFMPFLERLANVDAINDDALRVMKNIQFNKVVANIPYAISQKLLIALLKHKWQIAVLIVQKEFARKLKKGKLAMLLEDCADVKIIGNVPANAFYPRGVTSSIIILEQRALMDEKFWNFLNKAYRNKNKDVKNIFPDCDETMARKKLHQLTLEELKNLFNRYRKTV